MNNLKQDNCELPIYVFSDLDDTLFQTLRKCHNQDPTQLKTVARSRENLPLSFMTLEQQTFFTIFNQNTRIIPTTARNLDAFQRVQLPFKHGAILNYGGTVLLPDGTIDLIWQNQIIELMQNFIPILKKILTLVNTGIKEKKLTSQARFITNNDLLLYIIVKNPDQNIQDLEELHNFLIPKLAEENVIIHRNDNNLAVIPTVLNKAYAVQYVINNYIIPYYSNFITIGMGDSLVDLDFMKLCDYSIIPSTSQIRRMKLHD